jgi:hypothetical protein
VVHALILREELRAVEQEVSDFRHCTRVFIMVFAASAQLFPQRAFTVESTKNCLKRIQGETQCK